MQAKPANCNPKGQLSDKVEEIDSNSAHDRALPFHLDRQCTAFAFRVVGERPAILWLGTCESVTALLIFGPF